MNITKPGFRVLSAVLLVTLVIGLATPGRAEALEPLTIVAIAGAAVIVVIVIVFLVVANMHDDKQAQAVPKYLACVESDAEPRACWGISSPAAVAPAPVALATQSP